MFRFSIKKEGSYLWISKRHERPQKLPAEASLGASIFHNSGEIRLEENNNGSIRLVEKLDPSEEVKIIHTEGHPKLIKPKSYSDEDTTIFCQIRGNWHKNWVKIGHAPEDEALKAAKLLEIWREELSGAERRIYKVELR